MVKTLATGLLAKQNVKTTVIFFSECNKEVKNLPAWKFVLGSVIFPPECLKSGLTMHFFRVCLRPHAWWLTTSFIQDNASLRTTISLRITVHRHTKKYSHSPNHCQDQRRRPTTSTLKSRWILLPLQEGEWLFYWQKPASLRLQVKYPIPDTSLLVLDKPMFTSRTCGRRKCWCLKVQLASLSLVYNI
jgi:hypothetical protein